MFNSLLSISPRRVLLFCMFLSLFELLTYIASDVVMPGMLSVVKDLQTDKRYVPWSLSAYLLGSVAFQWLIGPLSDRFGRRPLLLFGCAVFAIACLVTPCVSDINMFIALRFIQGTGLGFVVVVSYPALQEGFNESDAIRLIAIFANIALLSPLLGPLAGSTIFSYITWRILFIIIAIFAVLTWLGLFWLMPETIGVTRKDGSRLDPQPLQVSALTRAYGDLLKNKRFMLGSIAIGLTGLPLMAWIALSPLLLSYNLGMSKTEYALWQLPIFGALIVGNIVLNYIVDKFRIEQILYMAVFPTFGGLALALTATLLTNHIIALSGGMAVYAFGLGICNAILYRMTLFSSQSAKGSVSAMLGMISITILGLGSSLLAELGASSSLTDYIIAASIPAFVAVLPIFYILTGSVFRKTEQAEPATNLSTKEELV